MESMIPEIKEIKDFPGYYVSNEGTIYSTRKNGGYDCPMTPMALKEDKDGYFEVGLYKQGKRYFRRVHRLVASAFIPNENNLPIINHKDGNKKNNNVSNLEWCTISENTLHSFHVLKREPSITTNKNIKLTNKLTNEILYFASIKQCAYYLNMSYEHLGRLLNGKCDITKWKKGNLYKVEYYDKEDVTTIR